MDGKNDDKRNMTVLDKKIQLDILEKIAECSEEKPLHIDSLTLEKQFNFKYLSDKNCLNPVWKQKTEFLNEVVGASSLTDTGQEFRLKLIEELEVLELRRLSVKTAQDANRLAKKAMRIAILCALISMPSWAFIVKFLILWVRSL